MPERFFLSSTFIFPALFWIFLAFLTLSGRDVSWIVWTAPFWMPAAIALAAMTLVVIFCAFIAVVAAVVLVYAVKMSDVLDRRHTPVGDVTDDTLKETDCSVPCEDTSKRNDS